MLVSIAAAAALAGAACSDDTAAGDDTTTTTTPAPSLPATTGVSRLEILGEPAAFVFNTTEGADIDVSYIPVRNDTDSDATIETVESDVVADVEVVAWFLLPENANGSAAAPWGYEGVPTPTIPVDGGGAAVIHPGESYMLALRAHASGPEGGVVTKATIVTRFANGDIHTQDRVVNAAFCVDGRESPTCLSYEDMLNEALGLPAISEAS